MHKRFSVRLIVRVALLILTISTLAFIFGDQRLLFNHIILVVIIILQVIEMIRFVNHTNRELSKLFFAIRHSDFSTTFHQKHLGRSFGDLQQSLAEIIKSYREVKIEKEVQYQFLRMLVNRLQIGIIAIENDSDITLINPVAEQLVDIQGIKNWKLVKQFNPSFAKEVETLGDNGRKLIELATGDESRMISLDVRTLLILEQTHKLITIQDINSEVEQKEIEAWQKLIRILTHEIMNSATPISSLTETMHSMLTDSRGNQRPLETLNNETIADIRFSLQTIQKRSDGLVNFVDTYRKFTKVPKPVLEDINVLHLFDSVRMLLRNEVQKKSIKFTMEVSSAELTIRADQTLLEQVLINLVTNSIHALEERSDGMISISAYPQRSNVLIEVSDNGKGIPEKEISEIFIPFFSTKKDGSGIGLSLSKQIMSLHGGSIRVRSKAGQGTSFYLSFRQPTSR